MAYGHQIFEHEFERVREKIVGRNTASNKYFVLIGQLWSTNTNENRTRKFL